jgi:hypothetical protein
MREAFTAAGADCSRWRTRLLRIPLEVDTASPNAKLSSQVRI